MKFGSWTYDGFKLDINFHDDTGEEVRFMIAKAYITIAIRLRYDYDTTIPRMLRAREID